MNTFINNLLGQADPFIPGFVSNHSNRVTQAVIWGPVALQAISTLSHVSDKLSNLKKHTYKLLATGIIASAGAAYGIYAYKMGLININLSQVYQTVSQLPIVQSMQTYVGYLKSLDQYVPQSQNVILGTYATLGLGHMLSVKGAKDDLTQRVKHLFGAIIGFGTAYLMLNGRISTVWNSSAIGLALIWPRLQAMNLIGSLLITDSLAYYIVPNRDPYNFTAVILNNINPIVKQLTYLTGVQIVTDFIFGN